MNSNEIVKGLLNQKKYDVITEYAKVQHGNDNADIIVKEYTGANVRLCKNSNGDIEIYYPKKADTVMESTIANAIANGTIFDDADEVDNNATMIEKTVIPCTAMANKGFDEPNTVKKVIAIVIGKMDDDGRFNVSDTDRENGVNFVKDITYADPDSDKEIRDVISNYTEKENDETYDSVVGKDMGKLKGELEDIDDVTYDDTINDDSDTVEDYGDYDMDSFEKENEENEKLDDEDTEDSEDTGSDDGFDIGNDSDDDTDELSDDSDDTDSDTDDDKSEDDESDDKDIEKNKNKKKSKVVEEFSLFKKHKSNDGDEVTDEEPSDMSDTDSDEAEVVDIAGSLDVDANGPLSDFLSKMSDPEFITKITNLNERARSEDVKCNNPKTGDELGVSFIWTPDEIVEENELNESVDRGYIAFGGTDNPDASFVIGVDDGKIYIDEVAPGSEVYDSFSEFISNIDGFDNIPTEGDVEEIAEVEECGDNCNTTKPVTETTDEKSRVDKLIEDKVEENKKYEAYKESFLTKKPKKLKPIGRDTVAYITVMINDIHSANDQAMLAGYTCNKIELVDFYITSLDTQDPKYIVPHTRQYLINLKNDLEILLARILRIRPVNRSEQIWRVNYPEYN